MESVFGALPRPLVAWGLNLTMGLMWAAALVCYGLVFRQLGGPEAGLKWAMSVGLHPLFIVALVLSLVTAFLRFGLFNLVGIERTIMAAPIAYVVTVAATAVVFREGLAPTHYVGMLLILAGVTLVLI